MTTETLIWLLPLPPLIAFALIVLLTNRSKALSHSIAIAAAFLSWLGSMIVFVRAIGVAHLGEHPFASAVDWLPVGLGEPLKIGVAVDPLTAVSLFFVAWTVLMIFIYSVGYHNYGQPAGDHDHPGLPPHGVTLHGHGAETHVVPSVEPMYSRFFAFIALFAFGMYTLVVSDNLLTLFVGWEIMGLCSYLLIGFWYARPSARAAAIKAFMTTRIGDVFMLLGVVYLYSEAGTLNFRAIFFDEGIMHKLVQTQALIGVPGLSAAGLIGILLFIGTIGKSAQFPLHVWLPDAMEGPTPVSAMIHAATMVSAGVYMVIRMFPLLSAGWHEGSPLTPAMTLMAVVGAFTALFAATIAVAQNDIKRVLAYSTISQLGYMIAALGIGAYVAAAFHLMTHAFFKALLFLGSGSVIHGVEHGVLHTGNHKVDPQDMMNMGGLRHKMPLTFITFLIGGLALAGFPFVTAGFWSKDEILADAFGHKHWIVFGVLAVSALLTAFYTARQITLTFLGKPRTKEAGHAHETPWTMTVPLIVLSVFAVGLGWIGIPEGLTQGAIPNWMHEFVGGTLPEHPELLPFSIWPMAISVVIALLGLAGGYFLYRNFQAGEADPLQKYLRGLYRWLKNKYYIDELYDLRVVRPAIWFSETFTSAWMDRRGIDGILHGVARVFPMLGAALRERFDLPVVNGAGDKVGSFTNEFGQFLKVIQTGRVQQYMIAAVIFVVGMVVFWLMC
ncbi:MAG: NADH-quinone oxidoreductase subunit L [Chloroflexota bacterium]